MNISKKKAFTLTELLVVILIIGILSAVALPRFTRAIETRKTGEAEEVLAAVRTEQEKRCALGRNYAGTFGKIGELAAFAPADASSASGGNYTYSLQPQGISAASAKGYTLKIPSYKNGRLCCEGEYCHKLNKNYPACSDIPSEPDECADNATPTVTVIPCDANPNQPGCCTPPAVWVESAGRCLPKISCTGDWVYDASSNSCIPPVCAGGLVWNAETGRCDPEPVQCNAVYSTWKTVSSGTATDTCPGHDAKSEYTCTDDFKGSCTDVRPGPTTTTQATTDQYEPLKTTPLGGWLLDNFNPVELNDTCNGDIYGAFRCDGITPMRCVDVTNASAKGVVVRAQGFLTGGTLPPACPAPSSGSFVTNNGHANATVGQGSVNMEKYCLESLRDKRDEPGSSPSITGIYGQSWGDITGFEGRAGTHSEPGFYCTVTFDTITSSKFEPITLETVLGMRCQYSASFTQVTCAGLQKEYEDVRTVNCCSSTASAVPEGPVTSVPSVTSPTVSVAP